MRLGALGRTLNAMNKNTVLSIILRPVKWVTLLWFLFGVNPFQPTLDFAFFILEWTIIKCIWCYIKKKSFQMTQEDH